MQVVAGHHRVYQVSGGRRACHSIAPDRTVAFRNDKTCVDTSGFHSAHIIALRLIAVALLIAGTDSALACSCAAFPDDARQAIAIAYPRADVIFTGTATKVQRKLFRLPPARETAFRVDVMWKGNPTENVVVRTNIGESACGYKFRKDTAYLVFGYWNPDRTVLTTSMCELTRPESNASALLRELEVMTK